MEESMRRKLLTLTTSIVSLIVLPTTALAYLTISESTELITPGKYQVGIEPQLVTSQGSGANLDAFIDAGINDSTSARIGLGFGSVDFHAGGSVKWIPFPDVDNQPGIGGKASIWYGRVDSANALSLQLAPLISKKYSNENGLFVPYIAIPLTTTNTKDRNINGTQFVFGTDWVAPDAQDMTFGGEIGLNLNNSNSYFAASIRFPFDSKTGFGNMLSQ